MKVHLSFTFPVVMLFTLNFLQEFSNAQKHPTKRWDFNKTVGDSLKKFGDDCKVEDRTEKREEEVGKGLVDVKIFIDECDNPVYRRFMHCNTKENKCECYRDWPSVGRNIPDYDKPDEFNKTKEWFEYDINAKECLIMHGEKCGKLQETSPYRCSHHKRCVERKRGDNYALYCESQGSLITISPFINFIILIICKLIESIFMI